MTGKLENYRKALTAPPDSYLAWQVYGSGFENVGKDGKPVQLMTRKPSANEIMVRVDAVGLCLSDIKIIRQGSAHPRLRGRDLATDPTVLGHECSVTVVKVGERWQNRFKCGQRFIVQADIYYNGLGYAFGYLIPGGLAQYCYLDERVLEGDEGCYLLPVRDDTGYSESALSEPWACVEMSYSLDEMADPRSRRTLIISDNPAPWRENCPQAKVVPRSLGAVPEEDFEVILVPEPTPCLVAALAPRLEKNGVMFLLGEPAEPGMVSLDVGRIHYENIRFYGGGPDPKSVRKANGRHDLLAQGAALFIGAGGPMGQMHVQRSIELPCGTRQVVVTDLDRSRLDHIDRRFGALAKAKGVELHTLAPSDFDSEHAMDARIRALSPNGYTDICLLAPVPALVSYALSFAADHALVNVFAGIPTGNFAEIDLRDICRGVKIIGSSGSRIRDLRKVLELVESRQLNTDLSVAAIGGLNAAREGLEAVRDGRFPGKTVVYPQIPDLPLVSLEEMAVRLPHIAPRLGSQGVWSKEAEAALLESHL